MSRLARLPGAVRLGTTRVGAARSDAAVIARSVDHPDDFGAIFERHHREILAYLVRRVGQDAAESLCAEVFVTAFEIRARYEAVHPTARPWLFGIAANKLHHHRRKEATRERITRSLPTASEPDPDPTDVIDLRIDSERLRPSLRLGLAALARDDRETLLLHLWAGLSYAEVAAALDIPTGTVRSRINRAKRHLRSAVSPAAPLDHDGEVT